ncbi:MAG: DoxX family protein [Verrucomicrobiota bacterium]
MTNSVPSYSTPVKIVSWILRLLAAFILLQTLFFKFTGAAESVYIFSQLNAEPWGRYLSGVFELIAGILLLIPKTVVYGAILALGVISGAIGAHLTKLGIVLTINGESDGGSLFALAVTIFVSCLIILIIHRKEIPVIGQKL